MKYLLGSGNHNTPGDGRLEFMQIWLENTYHFSSPDRVVIVGDSNSEFPPVNPERPFIPIPLSGNLGSFMELINKQKVSRFNGWTGSVMALAMIAYCNESDFIYKEADCLAFNDWVNLMYSEIGEAGIIFGNCSFMECEQSLFLVRHAYIPEFVRLICGEPAQNCEANQGEQMFARLQRRCPDQWKRFSMGIGRDRPLAIGDHPWYAQKFTGDELSELRAKNLI